MFLSSRWLEPNPSSEVADEPLAPTCLFLLTNLTSRVARPIIFIPAMFWLLKIIPRWNFPGKQAWRCVEKGCGIILGLLEIYLSLFLGSHEDEVLP